MRCGREGSMKPGSYRSNRELQRMTAQGCSHDDECVHLNSSHPKKPLTKHVPRRLLSDVQALRATRSVVARLRSRDRDDVAHALELDDFRITGRSPGSYALSSRVRGPAEGMPGFGLIVT